MTNKIETIEYSIVASGKNHNPTILNPDFLLRRDIVPSEWKIQSILCTEILSRVAYENKLIIIVEPQKIIFANHEPMQRLEKPLEQIAIAYVKALPEANYTAIGINFKAIALFASKEDPTSFIVNGMISKGPWSKIDGGVISGALTVVYRIDNGRLNFSVQPAESSKDDQTDPVPVIAISANFHRDLSSKHDEAATIMETIMKGRENDQKYFIEIVNRIFG